MHCLSLLVALLSASSIGVAAQDTACERPVLGPGHISPTGTINAVLVLVDFPDAEADESAEDYLKDVQTSSLGDFLTRSSFEKLDLQISTPSEKFYRMPSDSTSYNYTVPLSLEAHTKYVDDVLAAVGDEIDFDGTDLLLVVPCRPGTETISFSAAGLFSPVAADGTTITHPITFGADILYSSSANTAGFLLGYTIGLRYPCPETSDLPDGPDTTLGGFSLACVAGPQSPDYLAKQKWSLGWLDDSQVECAAPEEDGTDIDVTVVLSPVETYEGEKKLVVVPVGDDQYVMAEVRSRQGVNGGIGNDDCGKGVLVYKSKYQPDVRLPDPVEIVDAEPDSGGCLNRDEGGGESSDAPLGGPNDGRVSSIEVPNTDVRITVTKRRGDDYTIRIQKGDAREEPTSTQDETEDEQQDEQPQGKPAETGGAERITYEKTTKIALICVFIVAAFHRMI